VVKTLRTSRWLVSPVALLLAVSVFLGTADGWHAWDDDQDATVAELFHNHDAHRPLLKSRGQAGRPEHCYLCHWLRLLGNGLGRGTLHKLRPAEVRRLLPDRAIVSAAFLAVQDPARAPPA
jgi:hypothetical protein